MSRLKKAIYQQKMTSIEEEDDLTEEITTEEILPPPDPGNLNVWRRHSWRNNNSPRKRVHNVQQPHKCKGYMLALIQADDFIKFGAQPLDFGVYYKLQTYDGTFKGETVAIVGIPMIQLPYFFSHCSDLIQQIGKHESLKCIPDIQNITCERTCDALKKFKQFFESWDSNYLLILNIEPKGEGKLQRIYPHPRFTIPGGCMEEKDANDFLQCALREFKEETHIEIDETYKVICSKRIVHNLNKKKGKNFRLFSNYHAAKIESIYYVIQISY